MEFKPEAKDHGSSTSPSLNTDSLPKETAGSVKDSSEVPTVQEQDDNEKSVVEDVEADASLSPLTLFFVTFAISLVNFCLGLDNTIITTAIPKITDEFHALSDVGWYGSAYLMTQCSFQPIYGKIYAIADKKYTFLAAVIIFEIGSAVCGAAPNSTAFIIGRALSGMGGAGLFTGAILIVSESVPLASRPMYIGILGMVYGASSIAGPLIGGVFTVSSKLTWRWCFYINLPLGLVTILVIFFLFQPRPNPRSAESKLKRFKELDFVGAALLLPAFILLILALSWGGTRYPWKSAPVLSCLIISIVLIIVLGFQQKLKGEEAIIPWGVVKNRNILGAALFTLAHGGCNFVLIYYISIWFQAVKDVSAIKSGIMNIPLIAGTIVFLFVAGAFTTVTGWYTQFFYFSGALMAVGAGLCTTWQVDSGPSRWITDQLIAGMGIGIGIQQPIMVVQACLKPADVPVGTGFVMFANGIGGAIMLSVGQNVFTSKIVRYVGAVTKSFDPRVILVSGALELRKIVPDEVRPAVLRAYSKAITETFYISVALAVVSLIGAMFVQWKRLPNNKPTTAAV